MLNEIMTVASGVPIADILARGRVEPITHADPMRELSFGPAIWRGA